MKARSEIIWGRRPPYVRKFIQADGTIWHQVDNRQAGTDGKRERFQSEKEAIDRAKELSKDIQEHGHGATLPFQLRAMAQRCDEELKKRGRTIEQATAFYINYLEAERARSNSQTVAALVDEWLEFKISGKRRVLRPRTIADLNATGKRLKEIFPDKRIAEISTRDIENYLDSCSVALQTKEHHRNRIGQFFSWAVQQGYIGKNPAASHLIPINVPEKDVVILSVEDCKKIMRTCEAQKYREMIPYFSLAVFAGIRPGELHRPGDRARLKWDHINLETRQILVPKEVSKICESRHVAIENNLWEWLNRYPKKKGFIAPVDDNHFRALFDGLRKEIGFKVNGTKTGKTWAHDCCRHSYASYFLAKYHDRAALQENMGHSNGRTIGKHYKALVPVPEVAAFWGIYPSECEEESEYYGGFPANCTDDEINFVQHG